MKKSIKNLTVTSLSGIMFMSTIMPAFAQDYSYPASENYNTNTGYSQPAAPNYNYKPNTGYSQPVQNTNYSEAQNNYSAQPKHGQQNYNQQNYNQGQQAPNYNQMPVQSNYNLPPLQGQVVIVPPGTMLPGVTTNRTLSSKNLRTGDKINVIMNAPFYYAGTMVFPVGTNIQGTVVLAEAAGRAGKNGKLMIIFNQATTPTGQMVGLSGKIATEDGSGVLKGGTATERATKVVKDTAIGSGLGALLGVIFGAVSGGSKGKGAAMGTAIGGGTGLAKTVVNKGNEVIIEAGRRLDIILDSELRTGGSPPPLPNVTPNYNYGY